MSIAKFNARALLDLGLDRPTVAALQHMLTQTGNEIGATPLPTVAAQAAVLDLRAAMLDDVLCASDSEAALVSLPIPRPLAAGAMVSGRIVGVTSNGNTPGTLNLWLSVGGTKVLTHAFTTPDVMGENKGFAADFSLTVRSAGNAAAGGVLSLAYNAPTVLPLSAAFAIPTSANTLLTLGMNWATANIDNIATARVAYLSADKL